MKVFFNRNKADNFSSALLQQYKHRKAVVWQKENGLFRAFVYIIQAAVLLFVMIKYGISSFVFDLAEIFFNGAPVVPIGVCIFIVLVILQVLIHELLHALCVPGIFAANNIVLYFGPPCCFVHPNTVMTRRRYLIFYAIPQLITLFDITLLTILTKPDFFLIFLTFINISVSDIMSFSELLKVPASAGILNDSYYK